MVEAVDGQRLHLAHQQAFPVVFAQPESVVGAGHRVDMAGTAQKRFVAGGEGTDHIDDHGDAVDVVRRVMPLGDADFHGRDRLRNEACIMTDPWCLMPDRRK